MTQKVIKCTTSVLYQAHEPGGQVGRVDFLCGGTLFKRVRKSRTCSKIGAAQVAAASTCTGLSEPRWLPAEDVSGENLTVWEVGRRRV